MILKIPDTDVELNSNQFDQCLTILKNYKVTDSPDWKNFYLRFRNTSLLISEALQFDQLMLDIGDWGFRKWVLIDVFPDFQNFHWMEFGEMVKNQHWYNEWKTIKQFYG